MSDERPTIRTRVARAGYGDNDFRGYRVNEELVGRETMASMAALAVGGPRLEGEAREILEAVAVAVTVADPRIWPLKVTRIAGAFGSSFFALAAGNLALDGALMSTHTSGEVARRLQELLPKAAGMDDEALLRHLREAWPERRPPGFGVPARPRDERVDGIMAYLEARGWQERPYIALFRRVRDLMRSAHGLEANLVLIYGAVGLELGFSPELVGPLAWTTAQNALWANAVEASAEPAEVLRRLPKAAATYVGPPPRRSPRALGEE